MGKIELDKQTIKLIACDIDGVITDGLISIDEQGNERKNIFVRDLDAVSIGRKMGLDFAFITGEDNCLAQTIAQRFHVRTLLTGAKNKLMALQSLCESQQIRQESVCYIGDSDRDAEAIAWAGVGIAPSDGSTKARLAANYVTACQGGRGVLTEVIEIIYNERIIQVEV